MRVRKVIINQRIHGEETEHPGNEPEQTVHETITEHKTEQPEPADGEGHSVQENKTRNTLSKALKAMNGYDNYEQKHGGHFTDALAEWATRRMVNSTNDRHHWTVGDVIKAFAKMGFQKPDDRTWGDAMYAANMHYADYYMKSLPTEQDCLKQAYADLTDVDGYPEKIFSRWCADMVKKKVNVPWEEFT